MKKLFPLLLIALAFTACNDDDNDSPKFSGKTISFENSEALLNSQTGSAVQLGALTMSLYGGGTINYSNVFCAKSYATTAAFDGMLFSTADNNVIFNSYYSNQYDAWGGIALSANYDMKAATAGMAQQFGVWAKSGARNTKNFAVCYDSNTPTEAYPTYLTQSGYPTIDFVSPVLVDHLYVANSTWVYNYFTGKTTDSFKVTFIGQLNHKETSKVSVDLVSGATKLSDWKKIDLTKLGSIDKLVMKATPGNVATDPTYFCIDEIAYTPVK